MSPFFVVASLTLSHVTAIVLSADEAGDTSWSSMVMEQIRDRGSLWGMPAKTERPGASNCGRVAKAFVAAAMSSGNTRSSGFVVPVGWQRTASAALCRTPGMCTIRKR